MDSLLAPDADLLEEAAKERSAAKADVEPGKDYAYRRVVDLFLDKDGNIKAPEVALVGTVVACAWIIVQDNGGGRLGTSTGALYALGKCLAVAVAMGLALFAFSRCKREVKGWGIWTLATVAIVSLGAGWYLGMAAVRRDLLGLGVPGRAPVTKKQSLAELRTAREMADYELKKAEMNRDHLKALDGARRAE